MTHPTTIDKYQIVEHLGSGSFGDVYRVIDRALQAEKAIKVLGVTDPTMFLSSLEEAQILNKCRHKHIVSINEANIFDVGGTRRVILDLEYVPEGSLEDALTKRWVSIREAVDFTRGALLGLEHAHAQGILHRDIKPGNILIGNAGSKLSDFGLATHAAVDLIGSAQGYRTHLPPEYFDDHQTTVLSDVFAAGITLFRAASNISDWRAITRSVPNLLAKIEAGKLIDAIGYESFIPKPLKRIIKTACAADATKRYQYAQDLRQQLDRLRFNVDWICLGDFEWEGRQGNDVFEVSVNDQNNLLTVKKNGRRKKDNCSQFSTLSDSINAMHTIIADSTLQ